MSDAAASRWPWRREPEALAAGLGAWAADHHGRDVAVTDVRTPGSGMSNDTVLFRLDGEPLVARLAPADDWPTFRTYDFERQRRVIELVRARTDVPVPEVVAVEPSDRWLGVPFMLTRGVEGEVPADTPPYLLDANGWFLRGTPEDRDRLERTTIDVLARLHEIGDGEETAFLHLDAPGETALARQVADQRDYHAWALDGHEVPLLDEAAARLGPTVPANDRCVLNWGDSRPGNIIYRDFSPVAVLDWEMATVGPPELDLAWATFFHRFFASFAERFGLPPVPAMFGREATAVRYQSLTGTELDDLRWYEAFSGWRFGVILARMSLRSIAFGLQQPTDDPDDLILFAPLLRRLLDDL